jgi:hypothetical protein
MQGRGNMLAPWKGGVMQNDQILLHIMVFAGCAVAGVFLARLFVRLVAAAVVGLGFFAIAVTALGGKASIVAQFFHCGCNACAGAFGLVANLVHAPGVVGLVMGIMIGLHLWKVERERNRGIVRFPAYPSPE